MSEQFGRLLRATLLVGFGVALPLGGQSGPKPKPGRPITTWQAKVLDTYEVGRIYTRNDTTIPITLTRVTLAACANIRVPCAPFVPSVSILRPHEVGVVATIMPVDIFKSFKFTAAVEWRPATKLEIHPIAGPLASSGKTIPPQALQLMIPPKAPTELKGVSVTVKFFVSRTGQVDSVDVPEVIKDGYRSDFLRVMRKYQFRPAMQQNVMVPGTISMTITF